MTAIADDRGFFAEVARSGELGADLVQMNHSHSRRGVLRGLHYHRKQADLWYLIRGEIQIALADLRAGHSAPTVDVFKVSDAEPQAIFIPPGVAHGYLAITDIDLLYWVTHYYDNSDEYGVAWDDPTLQVPWAIADPVLSERDRSNPPLNG